MQQVTLDDVVSAIKNARKKEYKQLINLFERNYEQTTLYIARVASFEDPLLLYLKQDSKPGGFLADLANNVLGKLTCEQGAKKRLTEMLAKVRTTDPKGIVEYAIDMMMYGVTAVFTFQESCATRASEWVSQKLFSNSREEKYRRILNPVNSQVD